MKDYRDSEIVRMLVRQGLSQDRVGARKLVRMMRGKGLAADVASAPNGEGENLPEHSPAPVGGDPGELVLVSSIDGRRQPPTRIAPRGLRPSLVLIIGGKR
jgi:hypothetical protein